MHVTYEVIVDSRLKPEQRMAHEEARPVDMRLFTERELNELAERDGLETVAVQPVRDHPLPLAAATATRLYPLPGAFPVDV